MKYSAHFLRLKISQLHFLLCPTSSNRCRNNRLVGNFSVLHENLTSSRHYELILYLNSTQPSHLPTFCLTDCTPCGDGYTSSPVGAPCGCVVPMTAQLQLGISLETLFPLVAELAKELANGLFLQTSQVRIVGANAEDQDQGRTDVSAQFVPLDTAFDNTTADLLATRIWTHQVTLNETLFGNYSVIFVQYPGIYYGTKKKMS